MGEFNPDNIEETAAERQQREDDAINEIEQLPKLVTLRMYENAQRGLVKAEEGQREMRVLRKLGGDTEEIEASYADSVRKFKTIIEAYEG